ncbi:MAG: peptidoglycan-binding protein [Cellulosilyticaceae bacterium]
MSPTSLYPPILSRQSTGSLIVDVTSDPLLGPMKPLADTPVVIKRYKNDGSSETIAELLTDRNGQTPLIELNAPPDELTQQPDPKATPFVYFTIEVAREGYIPTIITGSQIFSTIESIQPVYLTPRLTRQTPPAKTDDIYIGPPTLYGDYPPKIPEAKIKDTNVPGFIVLSSVVVPEFVIVHDGSPNNNSAPNYTVPFKDYIKNVASSEIYPTWPKETIRANCTAITSFTLNRIFTEWYRNKGKNFTITNSTAYDHAFFYGRNIFDTISQVVDEMFDNYIKLPNVTQPLLSQYCDGARVSCPNWMSQWGSKDLGDDGLSSDKILRFYYGDDIIIAEAPVVTGNPASYPGKPLKLGDSGPSVRVIQEQLNRISNNYPLIPKVKTNGVFDEATQTAVKTFQKIFHLPQDGVVGKTTWYKISEIYVAVTKIAELLP